MKRYTYIKATETFDVTTLEECIEELQSDTIQRALFMTMKQYSEADRVAYLEGILDAAAYSDVAYPALSYVHDEMIENGPSAIVNALRGLV